jgi:hypothetical protein
MSVLSDIIKERRDWATGTGAGHRAEKFTHFLEIVLAICLFLLAIMILKDGPTHFVRLLATGIGYARAFGESLAQLFS